jgi:Plasmid Fertility inhibition factor
MPTPGNPAQSSTLTTAACSACVAVAAAGSIHKELRGSSRRDGLIDCKHRYFKADEHIFHLETRVQLERFALFRIPTPEHGEVWMRISERCSGRAVIEVDAERFLTAWRQEGSGYPEIAHQTIEGWRHAYKFDEARKGFDEGCSNPAPLADVHGWLSRKRKQPVSPVAGKRLGKWFRRPTGVGPDDAPAIETAPCICFTNGITRIARLRRAQPAR